MQDERFLQPAQDAQRATPVGTQKPAVPSGDDKHCDTYANEDGLQHDNYV
jgi:hypothetical protein